MKKGCFLEGWAEVAEGGIESDNEERALVVGIEGSGVKSKPEWDSGSSSIPGDERDMLLKRDWSDVSWKVIIIFVYDCK